MASWSELNIDLKGRTSGKFKTKCPQCSHTRRKKNDPCLYIDIDSGVYKCYNCDFKGNVNTEEKKEYKKEYKKPEYKVPDFNNSTNVTDKTLQFFQGRGISQETVKYFGIKNSKQYMPQIQKEVNCIEWQYFLNGKPINAKYRDAKKNFKMVSGAQKNFYNIDAVKDLEDVLICEGEMDVMSWKEAGCDFAISVPNGANKNTNNLDYLQDVYESHFANKKRIYIATDNDPAGHGLRDDLIRVFGKDLCYVITYPTGEKGEFKDANDILKYKGKDALMELIDKAEGFDLDGVFTVDSVREQMLEMFKNKDAHNKGTTTYFESIDPHWTWRKGDHNIIHGPANQGKSTLACNLSLIKSLKENDRWAVFSPEQFPPIDFFNDLIQTVVGKSTDPHFDKQQMSIKEYERVMDIINEHFFFVYPEDEHTPEQIIQKFKSLIIRNNITGIIIDPFNQVQKEKDKVNTRDDKYINAFNQVYKRFIVTHDLYSIVVVHSDAAVDKDSNEIKEPSMYRDIEGGKMWSKNADNIIAYYRPYFETNKKDPLCVISVQKIKKHRLTGEPGTIELTYEKRTNRFYQTSGTTPFDVNDRSSHQVQLDLSGEEFGRLIPLSDLPDKDEVPF